MAVMIWLGTGFQNDFDEDDRKRSRIKRLPVGDHETFGYKAL